MPWNEPLRVAERIALLDQVSGGRVRFGMGRGLSRREFANFGGIEMEESRERFDEGSMMVKAGAGDGVDRGRRPVLPAAAGADPSGAVAAASRTGCTPWRRRTTRSRRRPG